MSNPIFPDEISWDVEFLKEMKNFKFNPDDYYKEYFCELEVFTGFNSFRETTIH